MAVNDPRQRSIRVVTHQEWTTGATHFDWALATFVTTAFDGYEAWIGKRPVPENREDWPESGEQDDISNFDDVVKQLSPIPREAIYPVFPGPEELTVFDPREDIQVFFKGPGISHYSDGIDLLSVLLLEEAKIQEQVLRTPHPGLGHYLGCVVDDGRIVRLAFRRYEFNLFHRLWKQTAEEFPAWQRQDCMDHVEAAARHLHSLGLAHNDISPANIMFDGAGTAILIDLDACRPPGAPIVKGGLVAGWKGPLFDNGREFKESSTELDILAIQELRRYLAEDLEKKTKKDGP